MSLSPDDFPAFFAAVNAGHDPFPWQKRFLADVCRRLAGPDVSGPFFPELVDLPTGSGKTSLIDIAVFLLALEAERPPAQRRIPRRIVFVVDRRVVVDQAHQHTEQLARALMASDTSPVLAEVATALRSYTSGTDGGVPVPPLLSTVLRGGIVRDEAWARRPDMPAVISSTVDQVGSRLLFRGYGLSPSMQPIHAGLLGSDTLYLLDEVHLSEPFSQTLRALADDYQVHWAERTFPARWEVVELSATPGKQVAGTAFRLDPALGDFDHEQNETLPRRLGACKPVRLTDPVKVVAADRAKIAATFAKACVDQAEAVLEAENVATVAVIVNRVETAVAAHRLLDQRGIATTLLTGRMRPYDRDRVMRHEIGDRLTTGRERRPGEDPFVVVATQCIEAGADFDFDGMVTEAASLDSLIQRFGRVDRDGQMTAMGTPAPGVVLVKSTDLKGDDDPVYGAALAKAWNALVETRELDFGLSGLPDGVRRDEALRVAPVNAPILFPGHLDAWVQTNPKPTPDPDPKFWLHGPDNSSSDVTIVWRSDLSEALLSGALDDAAAGNDHSPHLRAVRALTVAAPPGALEAMSVPLTAARTWLSGQVVPPVSDVESDSPEVEQGRFGSEARPYVRWAGDRTSVVLLERFGSGIRPGDVVMVPATYGGVGEHGSWDPLAAEEVPDLAERTQLVQRGRAVLRLWPGVLRDVRGDELAIDLADDSDDGDTSDRELVAAWLDAHVDELGTDQQVAARQLHLALRSGGRAAKKVAVEPIVLPDGVPLGAVRAFVVTGPLVDEADEIARALDGVTVGEISLDTNDSVDSEPETSSFTAVAVGLDDHLDGVGEWASLLATNCGLSDELVSDLELAGRLHDLGKADPRFQVWLNNGDPVAASGRPLAKSAMAADAYGLRQAARARSGYPPGTRHELMSLAMIEGVDAIEEQANDWDLVQHLVASHHGWCRPFPPAVIDPTPLTVGHEFDGQRLEAPSDHDLARLDSGVPDRFWLLVRRYGWHRLAWFEAILRLADHRRSESEQRKQFDGDLQAESSSSSRSAGATEPALVNAASTEGQAT